MFIEFRKLFQITAISSFIIFKKTRELVNQQIILFILQKQSINGLLVAS